MIPQLAPPDLRRKLDGLRSIGEGWVRGALHDLGNYPGAVLDGNSEAKVFGRVFQFSHGASILSEIDRHEGYNPANPAACEYVRKRVAVTLNNGEIIESWMYEYNGRTFGVPTVSGGRWDGRKNHSVAEAK